jgi:prepilin-type N-terminal cleavage/methylation domain-containing protein
MSGGQANGVRRRLWTPRDDQGVTLPEVLIAIVILSIIMTPLVSALTAYLQNTDDTLRQMGESHDVQIVAAHFTRDVQSLGVRDGAFALRPSVNNTTNFPCNGAGTSVVLLAWDGIHPTSGMPTTVRVNYVVRDVAGEHQLRRLTCYGNATAFSDLVMVHNLVGMPSLVCWKPTPPTNLCTGSDVPQRITLTISIEHPQTARDTSIPLTLTGQRRQS